MNWGPVRTPGTRINLFDGYELYLTTPKVGYEEPCVACLVATPDGGAGRRGRVRG